MANGRLDLLLQQREPQPIFFWRRELDLGVDSSAPATEVGAVHQPLITARMKVAYSSLG